MCYDIWQHMVASFYGKAASTPYITVYYNPENSKTSTIPRHNEIKDILAKKICKDLGIPPIR